MQTSVRFILSAFKKAIAPGVERRLRDYYFAFRAKVAELYGGPKSGRIYKRPGSLSGTYQASAPGEPPAIASGRMFRSMREELVSPFHVRIIIDTPYAAILEGLEPSSRIAPRPFVRPALKAITEQFNGMRDSL